MAIDVYFVGGDAHGQRLLKQTTFPLVAEIKARSRRQIYRQHPEVTSDDPHAVLYVYDPQAYAAPDVPLMY